jgi:hypothetical protein
VLSSSGTANTLIAGSGKATLVSSGANDTLVGNAAGSTLDGSAGFSVVAAYALNNVAVNLAAGKAAANGASVGDTLVGIGVAAAFGTGDTLIGGAAGASTTLVSDAAGNTLIAGGGQATAAYGVNNVTVDLGSGESRYSMTRRRPVLISTVTAMPGPRLTARPSIAIAVRSSEMRAA